jgi:hypothetical protein
MSRPISGDNLTRLRLRDLIAELTVPQLIAVLSSVVGIIVGSFAFGLFIQSLRNSEAATQEIQSARLVHTVSSPRLGVKEDESAKRVRLT